jgi:hypothetical protein
MDAAIRSETPFGITEEAEVEVDPAVLEPLRILADKIQSNLPSGSNRLYSVKQNRVVPKLGKSIARQMAGKTSLTAKVLQDKFGDNYLVECTDAGKTW